MQSMLITDHQLLVYYVTPIEEQYTQYRASWVQNCSSVNEFGALHYELSGCLLCHDVHNVNSQKSA